MTDHKPKTETYYCYCHDCYMAWMRQRLKEKLEQEKKENENDTVPDPR